MLEKKGFVYPRYGKNWYKKNNTSCLEKGISFAVATSLKVAPILFLFNGRRMFTGGTVVWGHVLKKTLFDTLSTGGAVGLFLVRCFFYFFLSFVC
jgi:hypothetical protein